MRQLFGDEGLACPLCGAPNGVCTPHGVPRHALPDNTRVPPLNPGTRVGYQSEATLLKWGTIEGVETDVFGRQVFRLRWEDGSTETVSRRLIERSLAEWEWGQPGYRPSEVGPSIVSVPTAT